MNCTHPKHPAIQLDGSYCCQEATQAASHDLYYEPLGKSGQELHREEAIRSIFRDRGVQEGQ